MAGISQAAVMATTVPAYTVTRRQVARPTIARIRPKAQVSASAVCW